MLRHVEKLADEPIIITHGIKGFPYHFMTDKGLLQITHCPRKRTMPTKLIALSKTGNGGRCRGYQIDSVFRSLTWLESRLFPRTVIITKKEKLPF
jgi:hypothetical protein